MQNRWVPFFVNRFIYLSLPFFDKSEEECETGFEKWIYVLKYMEVLERLPFTAQKKIFDHLAKLADVRCLSSEEQEKYDESIKAVDDYYSGLYGSYIEGEEKGIAKVARNLLAIGMSWPQIIQATGLTEDQLKQLQS
jgi:predicted transposase/invertase (TIGR01784 family)